MAKEFTQEEIDLAAVIKVRVAAIRMKHSLRADREIKENLHDYEQRAGYVIKAGLGDKIELGADIPDFLVEEAQEIVSVGGRLGLE